VASDERGWCWGLNDRGQLGDRTVGGFRNSPVLIGSAFARYRAISAGGSGFAAQESHTCGLTPAATISCWGANSYGQLGNGTFEDAAVPMAIAAAPGVRFRGVSAGGRHTCALSETFEVYCWGSNSSGQLGNAAAGPVSSVPVLVGGGVAQGVAFEAVSAGENHTCGISGAVTFCWGNNGRGQLGDGTMLSSIDPVSPILLPDRAFAHQVSAGFEFSCNVVAAPGTAYCWGRDDLVQLGFGPDEFCGSVLCSRVGHPVVGGFAFRQVSAGGAHACSLTQEKRIICWGDNRRGQGGVGMRPTSSIEPGEPALLFGETELPGRFGRTLRTELRARHVTAGGLHTCAIAQNGAPYCWGDNFYGQIGAGTAAFLHDRPVLVVR
jgi:alpha-tubulin suppressor-like RCC1 family protein